MDDRTLYRTILGVQPPWRVGEVEVQAAAETVLVHLELEDGTVLHCPTCGAAAPGYDRAEERRWRHLDTCQYQTVLVARVPRVQCPAHGVHQVRVPWAEERGRFTLLFEAWALRLLEETTLTGLARLLGISWGEAEGILARAVARGLARRAQEPVRFLGVDETSFQKRFEYVTVVADLAGKRVVWVGDHRRQETLAGFYAELSAAQRAAIEEVVLDMWDPYIAATREALPDGAARIVFDRYHVMHHLNRAVDEVRRQEQRTLRRQGDDRLTGTKYLWLRGTAPQRAADVRYLRGLAATGLKVGRAWALKEAARRLWAYRSPTWARRFFQQWYGWAVRSRLAAVIRVARMMKRFLPGILGYLRHHHTNALAESLNAKIQELKYRARGYRNRANFRRAILFHCGGLNMDPR